jgi:hypothetical protein
MYAGHQVLEVSYSGDDAYLSAGGVIDLDGRR